MWLILFWCILQLLSKCAIPSTMRVKCGSFCSTHIMMSIVLCMGMSLNCMDWPITRRKPSTSASSFQSVYAAGTKPFLLSDVKMDLENSHLPDMASMHYYPWGYRGQNVWGHYGTRVVTLFQTSHFYLLKTLHEEERWWQLYCHAHLGQFTNELKC